MGFVVVMVICLLLIVYMFYINDCEYVWLFEFCMKWCFSVKFVGYFRI